MSARRERSLARHERGVAQGDAPPLASAGVGPLRPKGSLDRRAGWVLAVAAFLPLVSLALRELASPSVAVPGLDAFAQVGHALNRLLSLSDIPPQQRDHVLYLLLLPLSAMLVSLARLTFGIRVLGFRSILVSVGFHQSGLVPGLILISIAVATIVLVRPWLRRIRLPYYARVSVILCIVASTMVGALLVGPWMNPDLVWGMAYFPVIVVGMLAEGIAQTLDRHNVVSALWRAITTLVLAFVIALVCWIPGLRALMLEYPELVLTQIVAIVWISEYLDLRLLQGWDARVAERLFERKRGASRTRRVAVIRDPVEPDVPGHATGRAGRSRRHSSVRKLVLALRRAGNEVSVVDADASLARSLRAFLAAGSATRPSRALALNLASASPRGPDVARIPAVIEHAGIACVGPSPASLALAADDLAARLVLREAGVPTPRFGLVRDPRAPVPELGYPAIVRTRRPSGLRPRRVRHERALRSSLHRLLLGPGHEAFVEEVPAGRRISAGVLGNAELEILPLVEVDPARRAKICPALLEGTVAEEIRAHALAAFRALGLRDVARVDVCVAPSGRVQVVGVRGARLLARRGALAVAADAAGLGYAQLLGRVLDAAWERTRTAADREGRRPRSKARERVSSSGASPPSYARTP